MSKEVEVLPKLPHAPQEVNDTFSKCLSGVVPTVEEFLVIATWAYRATPQHERAMACAGIIGRVADAWIRSDRDNLPLTGSSLH